MLNVKLQIEHGDTKFEITGEVQITTVGYLQLREVHSALTKCIFQHSGSSTLTDFFQHLLANLLANLVVRSSKKVQHKLYDLDRLLKGKKLEDAKVREEVHASILKNVCDN